MKISLMLIDNHNLQPYNQMMKKLFLISIAIFLVFLFIPSSLVQAQTVQASSPLDSSSALPKEESPQASDMIVGKIVKAIEVKGNKTVGIPLILSKIKTRVGDEYLQTVISDDLKRLYNMGYFSDVSVDRQDLEGGFKVIFDLKEKPIVDKITFTKLRYFNPRTFSAKIQTQEGKFLDNKLLKDDIQTIKDLYVKKGLTNVTIDTEIDADQTTNKTKLHFIIKEGERVKITHVHIEGNKHFPNRRIMRIIKTRAKSIFTLNPGYLKNEILDEDMERIRSFYEKEGFIDCQGVYEIEEHVKGQVTIAIRINEGKKYFTGKIVVKGNAILTTNDILSAMKEIKIGKVFSREKLSVDMDLIQSLYFDKGYIFAHIKESTSLDPASGEVEISLDLNEGQLAYVNKVKIQGNTRTRDIVIRRELRVSPGDQFDGTQLRRSKERLRNLGYFEDVGYDIEDTDTPDKKDLVVQVKEAKTGSLSFGGGFSTVDQLVGFVEVEQKNFDFTNWPTFTGGGQDLSLRYEAGSVRSNARLSFTEPWIFDYPISGGFDLYHTQRLKERDIGYGYDEGRTGGDVRFGKAFTEFVSGGITYKRERIKIDNLDTDVSAELAREAGTNTLSMMTFRLTRDTRDNVFSPKKGLLLNGIFDLAGGGLGGTKDFYRVQNMTSYFLPLKLNSVLEFRLRTGFADAYDDTDVVPIFERFFAGGANTIRGYNERKVGPLDSSTNDPIGGRSLLVGNIEYSIPLIEYIKVAVFFDSGNVWSKTSDFGKGGFKSGTGLGLRIKTPIGPVSLDYGYPLNDEPGEQERSGKFYFNISRGF